MTGWKINHEWVDVFPLELWGIFQPVMVRFSGVWPFAEPPPKKMVPISSSKWHDLNMNIPTKKHLLFVWAFFSQLHRKTTGTNTHWTNVTFAFEVDRSEPLRQKVHTHLDVSENSGTPKSSILIGFSIINHPFWGTPIFGNTHLRGIFFFVLGELTTRDPRKNVSWKRWRRGSQLHQDQEITKRTNDTRRLKDPKLGASKVLNTESSSYCKKPYLVEGKHFFFWKPVNKPEKDAVTMQFWHPLGMFVAPGRWWNSVSPKKIPVVPDASNKKHLLRSSHRLKSHHWSSALKAFESQ